MQKTVYLETSVISYLAARPSSNLVIAGRQLVTTEWWEHHRHAYDLFVSMPVFLEAGRGDRDTSRRRLTEIEGIPRLEITDLTRDIADALLSGKAVPESEYTDALHISLAAAHGIDYLLTWNFRHIANASIMRRVDSIVQSFGIEPALICTPDELLGDMEETQYDS